MIKDFLISLGGSFCDKPQNLNVLLMLSSTPSSTGRILTEFRQPLQVQSHLEMPRILVQLGHTQRTWKLAPQTDPKWSPTWSLTRFQPICPLSARDGRYACQVSRAHHTHSRL